MEVVASYAAPRAAATIKFPIRATNELTSPSSPWPAVSSPPSPVTMLTPCVCAAAAALSGFVTVVLIAAVLLVSVVLVELRDAEIVELSDAVTVALSDEVEEIIVVLDEVVEVELEVVVGVSEVVEVDQVVVSEEVGVGVGSTHCEVVGSGLGSSVVWELPSSHSQEMEMTPADSGAKRRKSWCQVRSMCLASRCLGGPLK